MPPQYDDTKLEMMEKKIDAIYTSVEKTRRYILTTLVITIAVVVLPMIGLVFAIPSFLSTYTETLNSLEGL